MARIRQKNIIVKAGSDRTWGRRKGVLRILNIMGKRGVIYFTPLLFFWPGLSRVLTP